MSGDSGRALRLFLGLMGVVMLVAGTLTVLFGAALVPDEGVVTPDVDSEMRFYAVWYAAVGILLLRSVPRLESATALVRLVGTAFFVAGCARALSWAVVGKPHTLAIVLMVIELVLPLVIIPWQAKVAGAAATEAAS